MDNGEVYRNGGILLMQAQAGEGWSRTVAVDPTGTRLAVGSGIGDIIVRDTATGKSYANSRATPVGF